MVRDGGYGLPAFETGRWHTLILGNFFALYPVYYLFVAGAFALLTGFSEWRLGTGRTIAITVVYQFVGVLGAALVFWIFRNTGWEWAQQRGSETDVGFSAGMLAVLAVASATVRPPWRLRFATGDLGLRRRVDPVRRPDGGWRAPDRGGVQPAVLRPSGRPPRVDGARHPDPARGPPAGGMVGMLVFGMSQVIAAVLPDRLTPLGPSDDSPGGWLSVILNLAIILLIANGLRRGYRWAWWVAVVLLSISVLLGLMVAVLVIVAPATADVQLQGTPQFTADVLLSLAFLVLLVLARHAFRVPRRRKRRRALSSSHPETARSLLRKWGGDTISWMTTWPENRHMITADGEGYLAFVRHAGVAVALGDPVGPAEAPPRPPSPTSSRCATRPPWSPTCSPCTATTTEVTERWAGRAPRSRRTTWSTCRSWSSRARNGRTSGPR